MAKKKPMPFGKKPGAMPPMKKAGKKGRGKSDIAMLKQMKMPA